MADAYPCFQCGSCTATCPFSAAINVRKVVRASQIGGRADGIWACATCKLCEETCPREVKITEAVRGLRSEAFKERKVPEGLEKAMWGIYDNGNPWGGQKSERSKWADGLGVKDASNGAKVILYIGCISSFDQRLQAVARDMVAILNAANVDFGILRDEKCCGDVVYSAGEEGFLEELAVENIKKFGETGAERIVSISPHCFNMFRNVYPKFGSMQESLHYTELLAELIDNGKLKLRREKGEVTYHDPCYLGRYNGIYDEPRKVLESAGMKLREMEDSGRFAMCCGGGGGKMWLEGGERISVRRVEQASSTGAPQIATSCPYCIQNFEDSVKVIGAKMPVRDVAEIVRGRLG